MRSSCAAGALQNQGITLCNCIFRIYGKKEKSAKRLVCAGWAVLFPSGFVLFFRQYALGPGLGLALVQVRMGVIYVSQLPDLLPLNAPSAAKDKV
jgi:hypothetical protein